MGTGSEHTSYFTPPIPFYSLYVDYCIVKRQYVWYIIQKGGR